MLTSKCSQFFKTAGIAFTGIALLSMSTSFHRPVPANEEQYHVIKVVGKIIIKKSGSLLEQGNIITASESIIFTSPEAKASVISEKSGRLVLSSNGKKKEEAVSIRANLIPAMNNISSRSGSILNSLDLQNYFQDSNVILDETRIFINPSSFVMNDTSFFFARYEYKGEMIDKKILFRQDTILLNRKQLFTIDGVAVTNPEYLNAELFYYTHKHGQKMSDLHLVFPADEQMKKEVQVILLEIKNKTYQEKVSEVVSFINEFYGKPDTENVKQWLRKQEGLDN